MTLHFVWLLGVWCWEEINSNGLIWGFALWALFLLTAPDRDIHTEVTEQLTLKKEVTKQFAKKSNRTKL
jgi:hypothetical protein